MILFPFEAQHVQQLSLQLYNYTFLFHIVFLNSPNQTH